MSLSPTDLKAIADSLRASDWDEAVITVGDTRIAVARNGRSASALLGERVSGTETVAAEPAVAQQSAIPAPLVAEVVAAPAAPVTVVPAAPEGASGASGGDHVVTSPSVGVFWRSPEPGAAPFVEVGQLVKAGDTLGIVEIMKLMSNISADVSGIVTAIHVENTGAVEFGTPLVSIKPEA